MNTMMLNHIIHGDCEQIMKYIEDESIGLIVTSPPYNMREPKGRNFNQSVCGKWKNAALIRGYDGHDDYMPRDEYVTWQQRVLHECLRILRPDGAIFYNHKRRIRKGLIVDPQDIVTKEFPLRQIIIWQRSGGMNFNSAFFLPTYEEIYLICKPAFKLAPKKNVYGDVWTIDHHQSRNNQHPAPFPLELAFKCISSVGRGPVLDPFLGSGTTAVAAIQAGLSWIGIEKSIQYVEMALERLGLDEYLSEE